jgi:site-specific DNA-methyltransferase (adenine-specific)
VSAPYYSDELVTLYHGDCRDVLPRLALGDVALVLSDPPYGMDYKPTRGSDGSKRWGTQTVHGDNAPFNPAGLLGFDRAVLWGANWYADQLPPSGGWVFWDKTPKGRKEGFAASDGELAWTNCTNSLRTFRLQWGGEARGGEGFYHPTQKPVALMRWAIEQYAAPDGLILDPYCGAGPVLLAARDLGRRAIGIEIEERHCHTAAERLRQITFNLGGAA